VSGHTPGPWKLADDGSPFVYQLGPGGTNHFCLSVQGGGKASDAASYEERVAIARKISALPDLLAALETIANTHANPVSVARAAIAKVRR